MTQPLSGSAVAKKLINNFPESVIETGEESLLIKSDSLFKVMGFLKDAEGLDFDYLSAITAADYNQYFEVVYHLYSLLHNHSIVLKSRCQRDNARLDSLCRLWRGADYQEREIYDLFGIEFNNHPALKRLFLWNGFKGHPLRKDYQSDA